MSITIDDLPVASTPSTVKDSDAFYSANLAGGDVVNNYMSAKQEIAMTGDSSLVNQEKTKWLQEQESRNRLSAEDIISDTSVPIETRRKVAEAYVQGAIPIQDLRTKFMIESAVRDVSKTVEDRETQDELSDTLFQRDKEKSDATKTLSIQEGQTQLSDILGGVQKSFGTITSGLVASIPAGLAGIASLVFQQDPSKAADLTKKIQETLTYAPKGSDLSDEVSRELTAFLSEAAETIDAPFKWIGDQSLKIPMGAAYSALAGVPERFVEGEIGTMPSPELATGAYLVSGGITGAVAGKGIHRVLSGKPQVKVGSPIDTIETASKEQASIVTARALSDSNIPLSKGPVTSKEELLNTYVLPKVEDEFGPIHPDSRVAIAELDKNLYAVAAETELNAHVYPVSQILKERELYLKVLTETERSHLLLSSSILDIPAEAKLFGRIGKGREALIDSTTNKLEGTAVFGRNANFGYKVQGTAIKYMKKLEESVKHLPDPGKFELLQRDGQFYVSWKFTRNYAPHESLAFGDDVLSAHLFSKGVDITEFANGTIGKHIFPAYMRMKEEIPTTGAAAAREEARVESMFLREARDTFMKTKHPKELVSSLHQGEEMGKLYTAEDIQLQHPHLTKAETDIIHGEYVGFRRIVDHLYVLADRVVRKKLLDKEMKTLYNDKGEFVAHATEPLKEIPEGVTRVYDLDTKQVVEINKSLPIIKMERPIRVGDHIVTYANMPSKYQQGPILAGALPKIPGYIPRMYKEWFVVDKVPKALWVDGKKVSAEELRNYKQAVAMAGTRKELDSMMARFQKEDGESIYEFRREEKDISDKIIHDSEVYDTYLKEVHRRGDRLPSLDRPAEIEDVMVALTKTIRSVSKITAWDDLNRVRRDNFVKAYGEYTEPKHKFPTQINGIQPKRHMNPKEEREFLAAQSVYAQMEREQIASQQSDLVWKSGWNKVADIVETKADIDAHILREWGEKGFIPARTVKAFGSNLFLYWRNIRMWAVQPQQWKELVLLSPSYSKHLSEIVPITYGLLSRTHTMRGLRSHSDSVGRRIVPEYDKVISALEESGIVQSVDMNQMVHGIWKDATKELDPKATKGILGAVDKGIETGAAIAGFPGKIGRATGYNPSELVNQVSLWLYARLRWMEKNPGKNWDTPENRATIARDQSLYSNMSSTRAGMYGWQDGLISTFTQFVAIPWKSTLQMVSLKQFTGAEKARLAGARLFWYGKYGIPLGYVVHQTLENNLEDKSSREQFNAWTTSATDRIWSATLGAMFDEEGQKTSVDTKNLSTSIDGEYIWNVAHTLIEMGKGNTVEMPKITFPYENATGSLMETVRTIYDIFKINQNGYADVESWKAGTWKAVSFAGVLSDFNKAMLVEGISKSGNQSGYQQTRGEAIARLFGVPPTEDTIYNLTTLTQIQRKKEIQNTAKQIHQRISAVLQAKSVDEKVRQKEYYDTLGAFLLSVPPYYKEELLTEIFKLDNMSQREKKDSILLNLYKIYNDENDNKYIEMRNTLEKSNDPQIKSMLNDLESYKKRSIQ